MEPEEANVNPLDRLVGYAILVVLALCLLSWLVRALYRALFAKEW